MGILSLREIKKKAMILYSIYRIHSTKRKSNIIFFQNYCNFGCKESKQKE